MDKFRTNLALLHVMCNPGMRDRHWEAVSDVVRVRIRPTGGWDLQRLLDLGLDEFLPALQIVSDAATREHSIEKALDQMESEWQQMTLGLKAHSETGVSVMQGEHADALMTTITDHTVRT